MKGIGNIVRRVASCGRGRKCTNGTIGNGCFGNFIAVITTTMIDQGADPLPMCDHHEITVGMSRRIQTTTSTSTIIIVVVVVVVIVVAASLE